MSFFMNPFTADFRGNLTLNGQQSPAFICPRNSGRADDSVYSWNSAPYNLSGNDLDGNPKSVLVISYAIDMGTFNNWVNISVTCTTGAASASAVTASELIHSLNADTSFQGFFL